MSLNNLELKKKLEAFKNASANYLGKIEEIRTSCKNHGSNHAKVLKSLDTLHQTLKNDTIANIGACIDELTPKPQSTMAKAAGQRSIPRYNMHLPVKYYHPGQKSQAFKGYTHDIGALGMFIMANRLEKEGQPLWLEIDIPDIGGVELKANVVWTKWVPPALRTMEHMGFGVKITNAPENWYSYFMKQG